MTLNGQLRDSEYDRQSLLGGLNDSDGLSGCVPVVGADRAPAEGSRPADRPVPGGTGTAGGATEVQLESEEVDIELPGDQPQTLAGGQLDPSGRLPIRQVGQRIGWK